MWSGTTNSLDMVEGDWGIGLPLVVSGVEIAQTDSIDFVIRKSKNTADIIKKTWTGIQNNTVELKLTQEDTAKLPPGRYVYYMDWYKSGEFNGCLIANGLLKVVEKV